MFKELSIFEFSIFNSFLKTRSLTGFEMVKDKVNSTKYIVPSNLGNF